MNLVIDNFEKNQTTDIGIIRIRQNLGLEVSNIVNWYKNETKNLIEIHRKVKNYYIYDGWCIITIKAHSYTIKIVHKNS